MSHGTRVQKSVLSQVKKKKGVEDASSLLFSFSFPGAHIILHNLIDISSIFFLFFFIIRLSVITDQFTSLRKQPFLQIFIVLFPYISLFFHTKTLFTTMPTINHILIVNKTDFCSRNFLKIAGIADFRRKNGIS